MPVSKVNVDEYQCTHCGYKWINRVNGKDGLTPERCAKCKRTNWNHGGISAKETGLRRRIKGLNKLYSYKYDDKMRTLIRWNPDVVEKFLSMEPRPTIEQLRKVIYSSPLRRYNNGSDTRRHRGLIPDPNKPRHLKYDWSPWIPNPNKPGELRYNPDPNFVSEYNKLIVKEAKIRRELMEKELEARHIEVIDLYTEYTDPNPDKTYQELLEEAKKNFAPSKVV